MVREGGCDASHGRRPEADQAPQIDEHRIGSFPTIRTAVKASSAGWMVAFGVFAVLAISVGLWARSPMARGPSRRTTRTAGRSAPRRHRHGGGRGDRGRPDRLPTAGHSVLRRHRHGAGHVDRDCAAIPATGLPVATRCAPRCSRLIIRTARRSVGTPGVERSAGRRPALLARGMRRCSLDSRGSTERSPKARTWGGSPLSTHGRAGNGTRLR